MSLPNLLPQTLRARTATESSHASRCPTNAPQISSLRHLLMGCVNADTFQRLRLSVKWWDLFLRIFFWFWQTFHYGRVLDNLFFIYFLVSTKFARGKFDKRQNISLGGERTVLLPEVFKSSEWLISGSTSLRLSSHRKCFVENWKLCEKRKTIVIYVRWSIWTT